MAAGWIRGPRPDRLPHHDRPRPQAAGATRNLLSEPGAELIFRVCCGLPRLASKLLHAALILADTRDQAFLNETVITAAIGDLSHELPTNPDPIRPRPQTGTRSRR